MALSYWVRSLREMVHLAATFDRAFPAAFVLHQPVIIHVLAVDSVSRACGMERLVLDRVHNYGWTATNLPGLRALAHLREMLACTDDHLRNIFDHVAEGTPLPSAERKAMFGLLEEMAFVVEHAGESCVQMVRGPATTLAHHLIYLSNNAQGRTPGRSRFSLRRIRNRVISALREITHIMQLTAPMA
jgi:hypothetical protein